MERSKGRDESDGEEPERIKTKGKIKEVEGKLEGKNPKERASPKKSRAAHHSETKQIDIRKEKSERSGYQHQFKRITAKEGTSTFVEKEIRQVIKYNTVSEQEEAESTKLEQLQEDIDPLYKKITTDKRGVKINSPRQLVRAKDLEDTIGDTYEIDSLNSKYKTFSKKDDDDKQVASTSKQDKSKDRSKRVGRPFIDYKYKEKSTMGEYATPATQEGREFEVGKSAELELATDASGHEKVRKKGVSIKKEKDSTETSPKKKEKRDIRGVRMNPTSKHVRTKNDKDDICVTPKHKKIKTKHNGSSLSEEERIEDIPKFKTVKTKEQKKVVQVTSFDIGTGTTNGGAIEAECKTTRIKEAPSTSVKLEVRPTAVVSELFAAKRPEAVEIKEDIMLLGKIGSLEKCGIKTTEDDEKMKTRTENLTESIHYDPKCKLVVTRERFESIKGSDVDPTCMQIRTTDGSTYEERENYGFKHKYVEASTSTKQYAVTTREIESQTGVRETQMSRKRNQSDVGVGTGDIKDSFKKYEDKSRDSSRGKSPKMKCKKIQTKEPKTKKAKTEEIPKIKVNKTNQERKTREHAAYSDDYRDEICLGTRESRVKPRKDKTQIKKSKSPLSKDKGRTEDKTQKETSARPHDYDEGAIYWPEESYKKEAAVETDECKDAREGISAETKYSDYKVKEMSTVTKDYESGLIKSENKTDTSETVGETPQESTKLILPDSREKCEIKRKKDKPIVKKSKSEDVAVCTDDVDGKSVCKLIGTEEVEDMVEKCKTAMEKIIQLEEKIKEIGVGIENIEEEGRSIRSLRELHKVEQEDVAVGTEDETESIEQLPKETKVSYHDKPKEENKTTDEIGVGTDDVKEKVIEATDKEPDKDVKGTICRKYKSNFKKSREIIYTKDIDIGTREKTGKREVDTLKQIKRTTNMSVGTEDIKFNPKDGMKAKSKKNQMKELMKLWSQTKDKAVGTGDVGEDECMCDKVDELKMKDKALGTEDESEVAYSKKDEIKIRKQIEKTRKKKRKKIKSNDASVDTEDIDKKTAGDKETLESDSEPMRLTKDISVGTSDRDPESEAEAKQTKAIGKSSKDARLYIDKLKRTIRPRPEEPPCPTCQDKEILRRADHKDLWLGPEGESDDSMIKKPKPKQEYVKPLREKKKKVKDKPLKEKMKENFLSCIHGCFALPTRFLIPGQKHNELRLLVNMVLYRACLNIWATCVMILQIIFLFYLGFYWFRNSISWTSFLAAYYFNETLVIGLKNSNDSHHIKAVKRLNDIKERRMRDKLEEKKPKKKSNINEEGGFFPEAELEESESDIEQYKQYKESHKVSKGLRKAMLWLKKTLTPSIALVHTILFVYFVAHSIHYTGLSKDFAKKLRHSNVIVYIYYSSFGIVMIFDTFMALFPIKLLYLIVPFLLFGIQYVVCKLIILLFNGMNEYFETFIDIYDPSKYDEEDLERVILMAYVAVALWIISIPRYYINKLIFRHNQRRKTEDFQSERDRNENLQESKYKRKFPYKGNKKLRAIKFPILV